MLRPLRCLARATGAGARAGAYVAGRTTASPVPMLPRFPSTTTTSASASTSTSTFTSASFSTSASASASAPASAPAASRAGGSAAPGTPPAETGNETPAQRARRLRLTPGTPEFDQPAPPGLSPDELREEMEIRAVAKKGPPPVLRFTPRVLLAIMLASAGVLAVLQYLGDALVPEPFANSTLSPQWAYDEHRRAAGLPPRKITPEEEREFRIRQHFRQLQRLNIQQAVTLEETGGAGAPDTVISEVKARAEA